MKTKMMAMLLAAGAALGAWADTHDMVQLWKGGPYWATKNISEEKPEDCGLYFYSSDHGTYNFYRSHGRSIRHVQSPAE